MLSVKIDGMTCGACVESVQNALRGVVNNNDFTIDLESGIAHFNVNVASNEVLSAINKSGYLATLNDDIKRVEPSSKKRKSMYDLVPLYIILSYILIGSIGLNASNFSVNKFMTDFMGLFYIVFSLF